MTSPNPTWSPGQSIESPVQNWYSLKPEEMEARELYKLIIGSVVPRPIAFVSTIDSDGKGNLAPYSFFNGISSNPPCLVISVGHPRGRDKTQKDTLSNILETKQFVVNSANEWLIEPLVHCAGEYAKGVDEMEKVGLTPIDSQRVRPKRVKEAAIHFECELLNTLSIGNNEPGSATLVVGKIVMAHVYDEAYKDGRIDFDKIRNIGRLGGFSYGKIGEVFEIEVPKVS